MKKPYVVPYSGQGSILGLETVEAVARALQQDTLAYGPTRDRFEGEFAAYNGVKYAFSTTNCTASLFLSVDLLGLTPDRVPRHVKAYAELKRTITEAVTQYRDDVRQNVFPGPEQTLE